ncbi:integrase [Streptomyces sp. NBC_01275]|uniref:integrase n=1 Tax=Streptomyces sp. NBC_01275 TaxID=2903807 RepID=UPI00224E8FCB|nr:integrase [Streptomyces sp. NBC_01275]MCX4759605.1 integrase [Streptomyces sp. NBC_01275]
MNVWTTPLRPGLPLVFDGEQFTIAELDGRRVLLQRTGPDGRPQWRQVDLSLLMTHPSTEFLVETPAPGPATATVLGDLVDDDEDELNTRFQHVQEVRFGYKLGSSELALEGEPRPDYAPGVPMMHRYKVKAAELRVDPATIRRWVTKVKDEGPAGLVTKRQATHILDRADPRWLDMARSVLKEQEKSSRPVRNLTLIKIEERLAKEHGHGTVRIPKRTAAYELLRELSRGTNAFDGSTKGKRSIAQRPPGVYGKLRATRPGEYVILDTNSLDVYAMEPVTCRWVRCELTVAMDLYSRAICGLRLTPVSTKSVDVAGVLFETVRSRERSVGKGEPLPYCGVPSTVVLDAEKLVDAEGQPLLPSVAAEAIVFDHGKIYVSKHIESVCAKLDISLQPARPHTPTDKPVERWFRTLNQGVLAALPGYKGPDVYSRGEKVEDEAYFFLDELEAIIREWITLVYHRRHHRGLKIPEVPGLKLSPLEMYEHGIMRAGPLRIPSRPGLAIEFLEEKWCTIQHYGVEVNGLRYSGEALKGLHNQTSHHRGRHPGAWPIAVDRDDIRKVYFQHPKTHLWHALDWEHAPSLNGPASLEALQYARKIAAKTHRFPDTRRALIELLERWGAGMTADRTERRMAVRLSHQRFRIIGEDDATDTEVTALPTAERLATLTTTSSADGSHPDAPGAPPDVRTVSDPAEVPGGDDDADDECAALFPGDEPDDGTEIDQDDFYADILESR